MASALRHEIPDSGKRYDVTFLRAGENDDGQHVAWFIIDNGEYDGHRVSAKLDPHRTAQWERGVTRFNVFLRAHWLASVPGEPGNFEPVEEGHAGAGQYKVRYSLRDFTDPQAEPEIEVKRTPDKFKRDVEEARSKSGRVPYERGPDVPEGGWETVKRCPECDAEMRQEASTFYCDTEWCPFTKTRWEPRE